MLEVSGLFSVVVLFLDIVAILRIVRSNAGDGVKAAWIIAVLLLPVLGLVAWWFLGPGGRER